jgi:hypothetical protein
MNLRAPTLATCSLVVAFGALVPVSALADAALQTPEGAPKAAPPAAYSVPWQIRPAAALTVFRSDTSLALARDAKGERTSTVVSSILGSYKLTSDFAPLVRLAFVGFSPATGEGGVNLVNPILGATYALKPTPELRLAFFLGATIPIGMGGGDSPSPAVAATTKAGILARSAMDNAMFAVNDFTIIPGVDLAYVAHGFTVQAEVTLLQLTRVRGAAVQPDRAKTNLTSGLHVGYFIIPELSIGAEIKYQRWLSTPVAVANDATGALRDNLSVSIGPRAHLQVAGIWCRPGVSYTTGLDQPLRAQGYHIVQLDLPFVF